MTCLSSNFQERVHKFLRTESHSGSVATRIYHYTLFRLDSFKYCPHSYTKVSEIIHSF